LVVQPEPEGRARISESGRGDLLEALVAPHQAPQPGVLELLGAPQLGDLRALSRPQRLAQYPDRMHVENRSVAIQNHRPATTHIGSPEESNFPYISATYIRLAFPVRVSSWLRQKSTLWGRELGRLCGSMQMAWEFISGSRPPENRRLCKPF